MRRTLTDGDFGTEFWRQLATYRQSAWRWEQQPVYAITDEQASIDAFLSDHPEDPMADAYIAPWMHQVAEQTAAGKSIGRVRVLEQPPTDYQRWEIWLDSWNRAAGEEILYLSRRGRNQLAAVGPAVRSAPDADWWLFDAGTPDARLMIMHFDPRGVRVRVELADDPQLLAQATEWKGLAVLAARMETMGLAA
jgi:hypothetical protein